MKQPEPWNIKNQNLSNTDPSAEQSTLHESALHTKVTLPKHWKTWLAIVSIGVATVMEWYVIWSLLFIFWILLSIKNKELFFVERIAVEEAPITFWTTIVCWSVVSILVLLEFLITRIG